jgi:acetoin utilization deacetylase AcuC-like enzyme
MKVYFNPKMIADAQSFSPSASKPGQVLADWQAAGLKIEVMNPQMADAEVIAQAHDPAYVARVLQLDSLNGFGNTSPAVARSLVHTVGAMISATLAAMRDGKPAAALCSGFHHAGYASGGGFCTFNGLMVAAFEAKKAGAKKVGILDLDEHYGDGTNEIIKKLKLSKWVRHFTGGAHYHTASQAETFLKALPGIMRARFHDCDVLIYQAGADPYVLDPLGGWLTMEQLAERDRLVFETAKRMGLPVAWNLAGGYSKDADGKITPVLQIHRQTAMACIAAHTKKSAHAA